MCFDGFHAAARLSNDLAKSEMVRLGSGDSNGLARTLDCSMTHLPVRYLGLPLGANYKDMKTWDSVMDRFEQRLAGWKRNLLSQRGKFTVIRSTFGNLSIHYISLLTMS